MDINEIFVGNDYVECYNNIEKAVEDKDTDELLRMREVLYMYSNMSFVSALGLGFISFMTANFNNDSIINTVCSHSTAGVAALLGGAMLASSFEQKNLAHKITYSLKK